MSRATWRKWANKGCNWNGFLLIHNYSIVECGDGIISYSVQACVSFVLLRDFGVLCDENILVPDVKRFTFGVLSRNNLAYSMFTKFEGSTART